MFGGLLSLLSAVLFAYASATVRRGVLTGTVFQAVAISLPLALPFFAAVMLMTGGFQLLADFSARSIGLLSLAGVIHFAISRYCNYRATKAMGANLVAPVQQYSIVITLVLAVAWLGEAVTVLRLIGIVLVVVGPILLLASDNRSAKRVALSADASEGADTFKPNLTEGYIFALLSSVGFGISPLLIRMALDGKGVAVGVAGGFVSYVTATAVVAVLLFVPSQRSMLSRAKLDAHSAKWFAISGLAVCFSQMLRYMALGVAPVSVVTPIQRLSLIFRIYFGWIINRQHEVFGGRLILATAISLVGAFALSISTDSVVHMMPMPANLASFLLWHWP